MSENKGTETKEQVIPPVVVTESVPVDDAEARIAALEVEKAVILEREANYKMAYLKEKSKKEVIDPDESDEDRIRRITREELSHNRISQIDSEKEALLKKTLKENKELKLAQMNKTGIPASVGVHSESKVVTDTMITPEQMASFKKMGKTDKWIESYKKNLLRNR